MNRSITNTIRFFMDECLPPIIRDSRWFMYPFFYIWYKGKNLNLYMDFKSRVHSMGPEEFARVYRELDSRALDRPTDMNEPTIMRMFKLLDPKAKSLLDVGCGRGYWLSRVSAARPDLALSGTDVYEHVDIPGSYTSGEITKLPFADNSFDIVTATCILEHIPDIDTAIAELKRVARSQVVIVVPCQRYYYYTLDMHIHFFPERSSLVARMNMPDHICEKIWGDWLYIGSK